ncbi:DUF2393 domain-containing protein [Sulfurimonas sp. SAG-AH-194-L11]|nr:DUF2393 domain-containing protein [Sulfurimonas sp. SAG-AH-194-L11]MDF1877205.1 DUF2393 domain-containing protein [Sulfurimonas sp. SAG-AH-194-L11]
MSSKITLFIDGLIKWDYLLFGSVFVLFLLFIILAIVLRKKLVLALLFLILGFSTIIFGPTLGYIKLHETLFKNSCKLLSQKRLQFMEAVVVKGSLTNESNKNFRECKITVSAYGVSSNKLKNYLKRFKPFKKMSIVGKDIAKSETRKFKIILEPFRYSKDYNISIGADCR